MRVETVRTYESKLPSPDFHPYRTGAWTPNLTAVDAFVSGETREEVLDDECSEFPTIHRAYAGRKHRFVYAALGEPGFFLFRGLLRTDVQTGAKSRFLAPGGVFLSEAPFCPREGARSEDDGYVVTFTIDVANDTSACWIFEARELARGPVARVRLPSRIASGTHATWTAL